MDVHRKGSPLHMRGKEYGIGEKRMKARITPAYAGKRKLDRGWGSLHKDHPCVCGEKSVMLLEKSKNIGSPLRMRGKVGEFSFTLGAMRITPAYAGKSMYANLSTKSVEDHPCVCGEKSNIDKTQLTN